MEEKSKLELCAEEIRKMQYEILDREIELAKTNKEATFIEAEIRGQINDEMGADGKPLYSNDTKRSTALQSVLKLNQTYCGLLNFSKGEQETIATLRIELDYQKNMFEVYKRNGL